jgi:hypothetical protein
MTVPTSRREFIKHGTVLAAAGGLFQAPARIPTALMEDAKSPYYNLALSPAAADYERADDLPLPAETPPVPGAEAELRERPA